MAVSGTGQGETPQSLAAPAFAGFSPIAESGTKAGLTTGMTTDRKIFDFPSRRGIMAKIEYPGIAQLVARLIWVQEAERSNRSTRTKIPLKSLISEGFSYSLSIAAQNLRCVVMVMKSRTSVFPQLSFHDFETLPFRLIGCKSLYNIVHCF